MSMPYRINIGKQTLCSLLESAAGLLILVCIFMVISFSINPAIGMIARMIAGWFGIMIGLIVIGILFQALSLSFLSYDLTPQTIIMRGGIIARYERNVPFSRVQHIVITQTLMQRFFHLSTLSVQNADQGNIVQTQNTLLANISLPGLTQVDAVSLKKEVLAKVTKSKGSGIN